VVMTSSRPRPAVLCILDGWGHRTDPKDNAILDARTPNYDRLIASCPQGLIDASESFVGLPRGQMGNSEVGHMNLGAGRVAVPDMPRIDKAIEEGSLAKNPVLTDFIATLKKGGGACHLLGLASPGGVPTALEGYSGMKDGDGVLMFSYRSDRAREILTALLDPMFDGFKRSRLVKFAAAVGMVEYSAALNGLLKTLFPPTHIKMGLG